MHFSTPFYCQAYISDTSNEYNSNLSSEQGGNSTRFQKIDVQSDVQLTPTYPKRAYSVTTTKQQRKKIPKTH